MTQMINSKKGTYVLTISLVVLVVFFCIYGYYAASYEYAEMIKREKSIGDIQSLLLKQYDSQLEEQLLLNQIARFSYYDTLYTAGNSGGIVNSNCGTYFDYPLYNNKTNSCLIFNSEKIISNQFQNLFNERIFKIKSDYIYSPFEFEIENGIISGTSINSFKTILSENKKLVNVGRDYEGLEKVKSDYYFSALSNDSSELIDVSNIIICYSECKVHNELYPKLKEAIEISKKHNKILFLFSSYRTKERQDELWNHYSAIYPVSFERNEFVLTSIDNNLHLSGRAIDVRFNDTFKEDVTYDDISLLNEIMTEAGFVNKGDWWHYE